MDILPRVAITQVVAAGVRWVEVDLLAHCRSPRSTLVAAENLDLLTPPVSLIAGVVLGMREDASSKYVFLAISCC